MKYFRFLTTAAIILIVVIAFSFKVSSNEMNKNIITKTNTFPDSVKTILEKSCYDCHSNNSNNGFAKGALNFEKWDTYKEKDQEKYKNKICTKITNDKMPPSGYINKNPQAKLSEIMKKTICDWTKPINK